MRQTSRRVYTGRGAWPTFAAILLLGSVVAAPTPRAAAEWTVQTGGHVDAWWENDGGSQKGHQVLVPLFLGFNAPTWGVSAQGAYGTTERDPGAGIGTASVSSFTDTTLSGQYRLTVRDIELRGALALDLPSGKSALGADELLSVQDEDLVALERFGEGFDVNPSLTAFRSFGTFGLGLGVGYLWTGEYDPTRDTPDDDLDPGDELTGVVLGDFYLGDVVRVIALAAYTHFTTDERGGVEVLREGDELDIRLAGEWRPEPWWIAVRLRDVIRFKSERPDATGRLRTEARNSHGNDLQGGVTVGYIFDDAWAVQGSVAVRYVAANDYPSDDALYDGGRTKVAFGPSVTWTPSRWVAVDAGFRYFVMDAKRSPVFPADTTIHGIHADLRITYRF